MHKVMRVLRLHKGHIDSIVQEKSTINVRTEQREFSSIVETGDEKQSLLLAPGRAFSFPVADSSA